MAKRRGKIKTVVMVCVLALAGFGGYTLWNSHKASAKAGISKANKAYKAAKKELVGPQKRK
jgi:predicted negative regulator of RcsB-dependent stress response